MKAKFLSIVIAIIGLTSANAFGQTVSGQQDYSSGFTGIEVSDYFKATVKSADYYGMEWTVDAAIKNYIHVYLRGNTLVATVDRKSFDKVTKKLYSGKKAASAVLNVTIYAPVVEKIVAFDNAIVETSQFNIQPDSFTAEVSDNAIIKGLTVTSPTVTISASKKSVVSDAVIDAGNMSVNTMNSANVEVDQISKSLSLQVNGTSNLSVVCESETIEATLQNSSHLTMKGSVITLTLNASGKEVHAEELSANDVIVVGSNNCKSYLKAEESLSLDLKGGSLVSFGGQPVIEIVNIQNSSVSHLNL